MSARRLTIEDDDTVLYFVGTKEAARAASIQAFNVATALALQAQADALAESTAAANDDEAEEEPTQQRFRIIVGKDREDLTAKQRGFLHAAVFPQIAEQVRLPDGSRYVADMWKEYYRILFLEAVPVYEMVRLPGYKRAVPRRVRQSTEDLSIKGYSLHIDNVIAHATTEWGVEFVFREDEREAVRWKPKARKAKAREAVAA